MQIRSQSEHDAAAAELARLDVTRAGSEERIEELLEAIDAWNCVTGSHAADEGISAGDRVQMAYAFPDRTGSGEYTIVCPMPPAIDGEPQYRIEGEDGRHRVIGQRQIRLTTKGRTGELRNISFRRLRAASTSYPT